MARDRVLVIDDEPGVLRFLTRALQAEALGVSTAANGEEGYRLAKANSHAVVVLDLLMPGSDGFSVLRRILHHRPDQAVLVLSCLTDTGTKVRCLDMGAVDFLGKPFALDELLARIRARMRERVVSDDYRLSVGNLSLDPVRHEVRGVGRTVLLTRRESTLLAELIHNAGRSVSKQRLLSSVWGYDFDSETNVVDVYVRRLRRKLGPDAISTVRGVGYGVGL
jgi:DNA-binding response OmpR family regulator